MGIEDLARAQDAVSTLVVGLGEADWGRPSPCPEWDVAGVLRHLVVGERAFAVSLAGRPYDLPALSADVDAIASAALPAAYERGATALRDALVGAAPGGSFPTGLGPMPADRISDLRTIEALVHGWDLARGAGRQVLVDDDLAARALAHGEELLEQLPPDRTPFAPPRPVADDAPPLDRLVALLGRDVAAR